MSLMQTSTFSFDLIYASLVPLLPIHAACIDSAPRLICSSFWISALSTSILVRISDRLRLLVLSADESDEWVELVADTAVSVVAV